MLTLTNRIDMRPGAVPLVIHLGQYDSDFSLVFELYSSAGNFTVESGTTAMIRGTKTDGHAYDADATIDISAKTVTVAGNEQMTAAKGRNVYELVLTKSGKVLSTANFILDVERAAMDADTIASESVLKELNAIIDSAATSTQAAADAASAADRAEDAAESVSSASTQIATNTADIADLKADLSDALQATNELIGYTETVATKNLINASTSENGYIINTSTGELVEATGYSVTQFERINSNSAYSVWFNNGTGLNSSMIATYDADYNFIACKPANSGTNYKNTEANAYYIRVAYATSTASTVTCVEGTAYTSYYAYSNVITRESDVIRTHHLYVSPTGNDSTGDGSLGKPYATIYHANEVITDNTEMNRYVIHVADGFYTDLQTRYAGTYSGNYEGVICKDYVSYIGNIKNPANCAISWNGATGFDTITNQQIIDKCPFHIVMDGSTAGLHTEIAGFTIVGRNLRYALHIDTAGYGRDVDWFVHDCVFTWSGRPNSTDNTEDVPAIGTGSSKFEKGYLLRCKIQNAVGLHNGFVNHDTTDRYGNAYTAFGEGADIKIESCNFAGNANQNTSIWMRNMYASDGVNGYDRLHVIDCVGINELKYTTANSAVMKWRAETKCSDITTNSFKENGYEM